MDDDLSLFLGHNTERFTSWLHVVLQKLNAASMITNTNKEKEKKASPNPTEPVDLVKKHKKKKEKKLKKEKKEKKEKKKKKDKTKDKKEKKKGVVEEKKEETSKSRSSSPGVKQSPAKKEEEEEATHDLVELRPDADDLAIDLDEVPSKNVASAEKQKSPKTIPIIIQVTNDKMKKKANSPTPSLSSEEEPEATKKPNKSNVHNRLGPAVSNNSSGKRIINLREESSFPPKSSNENGIPRRAISSAISSAIKSVAVEMKTENAPPSKKLEARVRPLVSRVIPIIEMEESDEEEEKVPVSKPRILSQIATVLKRPHSEDEGSNDEAPAPKKLSFVVSKVEVKGRPRRALSDQPSTALIFRAVADAEKSLKKTASKRPLEDKEEPLAKENKQELFTRRFHERKAQRLSDEEKPAMKGYSITVQNSQPREKSLLQRLGSKVSSKMSNSESSSEEIEMTEQEYEAYVRKLEGKELVEEGPEKPPSMLLLKEAISTTLNNTPANTKFIVTMDGFAEDPAADLRSRLGAITVPVRTDSVVEEELEEDYIEEVEEWEEVEEVDLPVQEASPPIGIVTYGSKLKLVKDPVTQVSKIEERCRFWPACKEGEDCKYIHPNKVCATFPKCRFLEKCLYIHPKCKFDASCKNLSCPFTHSGLKTATAIPAPISIKPKFGAVPPKCRYFPKCSDVNCPFTHPKNTLQICRFGKVCRTANCQFIHPEVPTNSALKWMAKTTTNVSSAVSNNLVATNEEASSDEISVLQKKLQTLTSLMKKAEWQQQKKTNAASNVAIETAST